MIQFKTLRYKNLLSTGNVFTTINLSKHKSTAIVGSNGMGKSTMIDALCFGLYGRSFRDINKPNLINSITQKNLLVEVEFSVNNKEYLIRRGIKPSVFEIFKDGVLMNQDAASRDYQETLENNILKINFKSFRQIVVLGYANYTPFMQLPAGQRRAVIEDLLDIQIFSVMNSLLKERVTNNKLAIQNNEYAVKLAKSKLEMDRKRVADLRRNNTALISEKIEKIKTYKSENKKLEKEKLALEEQHKELESKLVDSSKVRSRFDQFKELKIKLTHQSSKLTKEVKFYKDSESCPTCKQTIDEKFKESVVEKREKNLQELVKALDTVDSNLASLQESINEIKQLHDQSTKIFNEISAKSFKINANLNLINNAQEEINNLRLKNTSYTEENNVRQSLVDEYENLNKERAQLIADRELYSIASQLLKDGGIKTRIIRQYVPVINKLINKHLAALDFFCQFEIDENFDEKIKSRGRDNFTYESFSQGERLRIDLSLMFAWRALAKIRNSTNCNLLILDEILDSSLDDQGVEDFMKIISKMTQDQNTFIISHKTDSILDKFDNVIRFEKVKNFSRIVHNGEE